MDFKFENLVLIVGTNPLPNYVVANYFIQKNLNLKKIYLLHSEQTPTQAGTNIYAENLTIQLTALIEKSGKNIEVAFQNLQIKDVAKKRSIEEVVQNQIIDKIEGWSKVHLDYTGGTKSMTTYTYLTFHNNHKNLEMSYSYLDARGYKLVFDNSYIEYNLLKFVSISFSQLIGLHGFIRKNKDKYEILKTFEDPLKEFSNLIEKGNINDFYSKKGGYTRKIYLNKEGKLDPSVDESSVKFKEHYSSKNSINSEFSSVVGQMNADLKIFNSEGNFNCKISKKNLTRAVKFLDGDWLELYVHQLLKEAPLSNYENLLDWEIKKPVWKNNYFQIDNILMKGYQLIGISCTTAYEKSLCKNKGFEILLRTQQIGGSEAKSVLLTRMPKQNIEILQEDLVVDTGTGRNNIKVLGVESWKKDKFIEEIISFIE